MTERWWWARNKERHGPYSVEQLRCMVANGQLQPADMLLKDGTTKWVAASSVSGLFKRSEEPARRPIAAVSTPSPSVTSRARKQTNPHRTAGSWVRRVGILGILASAGIGIGWVVLAWVSSSRALNELVSENESLVVDCAEANTMADKARAIQLSAEQEAKDAKSALQEQRSRLQAAERNLEMEKSKRGNAEARLEEEKSKRQTLELELKDEKVKQTALELELVKWKKSVQNLEDKRPQRTEIQENESAAFPSGKGVFLFERTRPPQATIKDFAWSMSRRDFQQSYGVFLGGKWIEDEGILVKKDSGHYSHLGPGLQYGELLTRYDFKDDVLFALQLHSTLFLTLEPQPYQKDDWKLLKEQLHEKFGTPDSDRISEEDRLRKVFYFREWRFPKSDRIITFRLYRWKGPLSKSDDFDHERSYIVVRKLSVALTPECPRWEFPVLKKE